MSLLLEAMQRATESRQGPEATDPARRASGTPPSMSADALADLASRPKGSTLFPVRDGRGGRAALGPRAPSSSAARWMERVRDKPVHTFAALAGLFLVFYFIYVYVAISHPGLLRGGYRGVDMAAVPARPQAPPPPATPASPVAERASAQIAPPLPPLETLAPTAGAAAQARLPSLPLDGTRPAPGGPGAGSAPVQASEPARPNPAAPTSTTGASSREAAPAALPAPSAPTPGNTGVAEAPRRNPAAEAVTATTPSAVRTAPPARRPADGADAASVPSPDAPVVARTSAPEAMGARKGRADEVRVQATDAGELAGRRLAVAYQAMQGGDPERARSLYGAVLAADSRNVDALLGLAAVATTQGRVEEAAELHERVLAIDPQNVAAQAGVASLAGRAEPIAAETRLRLLLGREPSSALYSSLGNLLAGQGRWQEAQQAWFQAYQLEPGNPDHIYNLAVGLDRLGQAGLAARYYRQALESARTRGGIGFDQSRARARLEKLGTPTE